GRESMARSDKHLAFGRGLPTATRQEESDDHDARQPAAWLRRPDAARNAEGGRPVPAGHSVGPRVARSTRPADPPDRLGEGGSGSYGIRKGQDLLPLDTKRVAD